MGLGIYQLELVMPPAHSGGQPSLATDDDIPVLQEWLRDFFRDTGSSEQEEDRVSPGVRVC